MQEKDSQDPELAGFDFDDEFLARPPGEKSDSSPPEPAKPTGPAAADAKVARDVAQECCDVCGFMEAGDRMRAWIARGERRVVCSECLPSVEPEQAHGFEVAWIPEMSHADVSHLCRVIALAVWRQVRNKTDDMRARPVPDVFADLADRVKESPSQAKDDSGTVGGPSGDLMTMVIESKDYMAKFLGKDGEEGKQGSDSRSPFMEKVAAPAMLLLPSGDAGRAVYATLTGRIGVARTVLGTSDPAEVREVLEELPDDYRDKAIGAIRYIPLEIPFNRIKSWAEVGSFRDVMENGEVSA